MDFEAVFNCLPIPTMVTDGDFNIVAMNSAYLDATGAERDKLVGANVFDAFPGAGEARLRLQQSFERARDKGVADVLADLDYVVVGAGGVEERRWSSTQSPISGPDGKVAYIVQNAQDLSCPPNASAIEPLGGPLLAPFAPPDRIELIRVLNQTLLATAHHLHRLFMQASNVMCVLRGPDHQFEMVNKSFAALIGRREINGLYARDVLPAAANQALFELLDKVFETGEGVAVRKMRILLTGADAANLKIRELYFDVICQPIVNDVGATTGVFAEGVDVTEIVRAEQRQALLIRELHHRVRNTLATVQGVMNTTARSSATIAEFQEAFAGRIASLAKTHAVMTDELDQCVSFEHLLNQELGFYAGDGGDRIHLNGPPVELPSQIAVPLGMAVHELTTNAVKYGALAYESGQIAVDWSLADGPSGAALSWEWRETGGPKVAPPDREGFGSMLLKRVLSQQIGAEVNVAFEPEGFRLRMLIPLRAER